MKAIILAGGKGTRLKPLTNTIPKPMVRIHGKPILEHIINHFKTYDINTFIVSLCYLPQIITEYFGDGSKFGVQIHYTLEKQSFPLGTAGAVRPAKDFIHDRFIVTYGDILRTLNIRHMIEEHEKKQAFATLNVYKRYGPCPKSQILFSKSGKITKFIERPTVQMGRRDFVWSNGSFYIFEPEIFQFIPHNRPSDFGRDIIPDIISEKKLLFVYPTDGYLIDIGNHRKLSEARGSTTIL